MDRNYDITTSISKCLYFKRSREVNFADIIKIATMVMKTNFKDSKSLKNRNFILKCNRYLYFFI